MLNKKMILSAAAVFAAFSAFCINVPDAYSFRMLGDIHLDIKKNAKEQAPIIQKKTEMLQAAGKIPDCTFTIQIGDLANGKNLPAWNALRENVKGPLLYTKGNHEMSGKYSAVQKFNNEVRPLVLEAAGETISVSNRNLDYAVKAGKDLFVVLDSNEPCKDAPDFFKNRNTPDIEFVKKALDLYPNARHVFLVCHLPLIPCQRWNEFDWTIYGRQIDKDDIPEAERKACRDKLIHLLASRNTIILCGHIHTNSLIKAEFPEGKIIQLAGSSVVQINSYGTFRKEYSGTDHYLTDREAAVAKSKNQYAPRWIKLVREFAPFVKEYKGFDGTCVIRINCTADGSVSADFFNPATKTVEKTWNLTEK